MTKRLLLLGALVMVGLWLLLSPVFFTVDQYEDIAIVKTFGQVAGGSPLKGAEGAGLRFKAPWPIQSVTFYRACDRITEDANEQVTTKDGKTILVSSFCNWRIETPIRFDSAVGGSGYSDKAEQFVRNALQTSKGSILNKHNMDEIINTDPSKMKLGQIESDILQSIRAAAKDQYGIDVTYVGINVLGLTPNVSRAVLQNQIAERNAEAVKYEEQGKAQAMAIVSRASTAANEIMAFAQRRAEFIRTEGQRDAGQYYATFKENERLAMYLRMLESLRKELPNKSMLILDSSWNPLLENFYKQPTLDSVKLPDEVKKASEGKASSGTSGK